MDYNNVLPLAKVFSLLYTFEEVYRDYSAHNLSVSEFRTILAIFCLAKDNKNSTKRIANYLGLSSSSLCLLVNDLTNKGYTQKMKSLSDKRIVYVNLTELGMKAIHEYMDIHEELYERIISLLGVPELNLVCDVIKAEIKVYRLD